MKFRVTIMPGSDKPSINSVGKTNIPNAGFVARNSESAFTPGGITNSLKNITGQEGLILTSDEIMDVSVNISDISSGVVSNTESTVSVRIGGILLTHLDEDNTDNSPLNMKNLLSGYADDKLNGVTKGLVQGIYSLGNIFGNNLSSTLSGMLDKGNFGLNDLYKTNLKNSIELAKWSLSYGEKSDYRDIVVEVIISDSVSKTYILPDMFAVKYSERLSVRGGNGIYEFLLQQKRYSSRKIEIK